MQFSGTRKFVANLGNWGEKYEASRSITMSHQDLGYSDEEWLEHVREVGTHEALLELGDAVMDEVTEEILGEVEEANALRDQDEPSFVLRVLEPKEKKTSKKKVKRKKK